MTQYRLRSYDTSPSGGYYYFQDGEKSRKFHPEPIIEALAKTVWKYRQGNGLSRATYKESLEDVDRYNCARMGNNPLWCVACEMDDGLVAVSGDAPGLAPCRGCGAPIPP